MEDVNTALHSYLSRLWGTTRTDTLPVVLLLTRYRMFNKEFNDTFDVVPHLTFQVVKNNNDSQIYCRV